ncbi:hypothetical protein ACHAW5_001206 [Stephanodiscus triporus]|uniref:Uncharacterized protein n=1 Tax=Stephanodiscus triporus TaxID=2934178 RepID=A0ABD3N7C6_9STRA
MKLCLSLSPVVLAASISSVGAYTAGAEVQRRHTVTLASPQRVGSPAAKSSTTTLRMSDFDFPSAMPQKPQQTMKEKLNESATQFIADLTTRLGKGVDPPPEMEVLREARDADGDEKTLALRIYELMIEQGMTYDIDADTGRLTPTQFDVKNNLDIPEVKAEFKRLYAYGIELIKRGLIDLETCKDVVKKRLIDRTGLSPEDFDKWLGY